MKLGKTALSHFSSQVIVTLAGFAATWLIAVVLGAEGLGTYSIILSLGFFWLVIPSSAVGKAIKKRMSEGEDPAAYLGGGLVLNGLFAGFIAVLVFSVSGLLSALDTADNELVRTLIKYDAEVTVLALATISYRTVHAVLKGQKRVSVSGWLKAGERVARTVFQVATLLLSYGIVGITLGHTASLVLTTLVAVVVTRCRPVRPSVDHVRSLLSYARYAWLGALRSRVFGWMDTIVLAGFVGASLIGIYEAAWGIASMLSIASASISQTLFPEVSELSNDASYDRIRHYLNEALAFSAILIIPGLFGAAALGDRVLSFYRPEFQRGTGILLILIAAYLADVFATQFMSVINGVDRPDAAFRINVVFIVTNLVLNVVLVWQFGWYGAAVATALSTGLRAAAGYLTLRRILGAIDVPYSSLGRQVIAGAVMTVAVLALAPTAPDRRIGTLLLVGVGATVYAVILLGIGPRIRTKTASIVRDIS